MQVARDKDAALLSAFVMKGDGYSSTGAIFHCTCQERFKERSVSCRTFEDFDAASDNLIACESKNIIQTPVDCRYDVWALARYQEHGYKNIFI